MTFSFAQHCPNFISEYFILQWDVAASAGDSSHQMTDSASFACTSCWQFILAALALSLSSIDSAGSLSALESLDAIHLVEAAAAI